MPHLDGPLRRAILLRHGQTAWNLEGRWQGRTDVPLDPTGLVQAERAAEVLVRDASIVVLTYSPLKRAAQTAAVLKGAFDLQGRPLRRSADERLVEIDVGVWSGMLSSEVEEQFRSECGAIAEGEDIPRGLDGETLAEVAVRARRGFDEAVSGLGAGESALLVMHGAAIRALAANLVAVPPSTMDAMLASIGNCRWATLVGNGPRWVIESWNVGAGSATA